MDPEGFEPSPNTLMGYRTTVTPRAHAKSLSQRGAFAMLVAKICPWRVSFRERRFRRRPKMHTAPGITEAVARTDKSVPRQGHPYYRDNTATNQVTSRRAAPRPANPPLVPERQSFQRRNGPGGIR